MSGAATDNVSSEDALCPHGCFANSKGEKVVTKYKRIEREDGYPALEPYDVPCPLHGVSSEDAELRPCPFCGGQAEVGETEDHHGKPWPAVRCMQCGAEIAENAEEQAVAAWNTRIANTLESKADDVLTWLASNPGMELTWGEIDDDPSECAWRVHRRHGGYNDQEWDLIATGETPEAALVAAIGRAEGEKS